MPEMQVTLESFTDRGKRPRFRGRARNGEIVFASEAYSSAAARLRTMRRLAGAVIRLAPALCIMLALCGCVNAGGGTLIGLSLGSSIAKDAVGNAMAATQADDASAAESSRQEPNASGTAFRRSTDTTAEVPVNPAP